MRNQIFASLLAVCLIGCGGGSGSKTYPFTGAYEGFWRGSNAQEGTCAATVNADGALIGTVHDATAESDGTVAGRIGGGGQADLTVHLPGQADTRITGRFRFTGSNTIVGQLDTLQDGQVGEIEITLVRP